MRVLSLFDGISCGQIALERAGFKIDKYFAYEIDKYAIQITQKNYPNTTQCGDVTIADFTQYKDNIDVLIGGSPCTYWSKAKNSKAKNKKEINCDGIGYVLFSNFARAIKETNVKYFLYENNYGIHEDIKEEITKELGVQPIMINSNLLSAQNRKRYYWTNIPNIKIPKDKGILIKDIIDTSKLYDKPYDIYQYRETKNYIQFDVSGKGYNSQQDRAYYIDTKFATLPNARAVTKRKITNKSGFYRDLSLSEWEKLQTIPERYTLLKENFSLNKSMSAIGNGWTVDVIAHILSFLKEEDYEDRTN